MVIDVVLATADPGSDVDLNVVRIPNERAHSDEYRP
jgi:hypothetical protein